MQAYIRLERVKKRLQELVRQMGEIDHEVKQALKEENQEKASFLYAQYFQLGHEYFHLKEIEEPNLEAICEHK